MTAISLWVHVDMKSEMLMEMLGDWQHDTTTLADLFQDAEPFPHVVIDDFFSAEVADRTGTRAGSTPAADADSGPRHSSGGSMRVVEALPGLCPQSHGHRH